MLKLLGLSRIPDPLQLMFLLYDIRKDVRLARDARGDDRCWVDDFKIWRWLKDINIMDYFPASREDRMQRCVIFYETRRADQPDPVPKNAILDPTLWNRDFVWLDPKGLAYWLEDLVVGIKDHRDKHRLMPTIEDDRKLYSLLPENIPADFRLPPVGEFLGRQKEYAGCPLFWDSHSSCKQPCNFHQWGPCNQALV